MATYVYSRIKVIRSRVGLFLPNIHRFDAHSDMQARKIAKEIIEKYQLEEPINQVLFNKYGITLERVHNIPII